MAKKLLVLLVTFAMLCTLAPVMTLAEDTTTAAATTTTVPYSDIFGTPFESAFIKLHLMGIFTGYPDKTFKPDRPITRAEFLAVTLRALNFEKYVNGFKGATKYPDTPVDHWATGYINAGTAFGIVKGYPDGTFRPDSNVTYAEATTMLVRMLGYTQYITPVTPGGGTEDWFANFVKMAVALGDPSGYGMNVHPPELVLPDGILTGVTSFNASAPASRGDLAIMVYNSLFVYCLGPVEWMSQGPVPGAFYYPTNTTLAENLGFHEMETIVTNAPPYDAYAGSSQIELFEGWTTVVDGSEVFVPVTEDPMAFAAAHGLTYPKDFKPVHRLYEIPADSIWVSGKPADLTTLIGKPVRVIYEGPEPKIGQDPYANPSKLWYVRVLNHLVENYKVAANKVGSYWFPGKTVGEIFADLKLRVYQADPNVTAKSATTLSIDPRAVIFLEDVYIENPNVMLVKDADVSIVRGVQEIDTYKDYEGHLYASITAPSRTYAVLAKVWPGHIMKDVLPTWATTAEYDRWGRVVNPGIMAFTYTDDNTFNKRLPTPYPTYADYMYAQIEDDAKWVLGGGEYTNWNWYTPLLMGFSAIDWFVTNYYPVGTVRLAPVKNLDGENLFSVIHFEGNESTQSGTLEDIFRTKDQWGNDWITQIKVSGKVYDVLFPGRGEAPVIAASTTGTKEEPTAPVGQVGGVESGATFGDPWDETAQLVFNNLWDERNDWLGQPVDLVLNKDGKVRFMTLGSAAAAAAFLEYGMVTRVNMNQDSAGYHLSIDVMKGDGTVVNYPLTEASSTDLMIRVYYPPYGDNDYNLVPYEPSMGKVIIAKFTYYNDHNRGTKGTVNIAVKGTDYNSVYAIWQKLQNLVRDVVRITKDDDGNYVFNELATNPGQYQAYNTEGIIDEIGPTFDGTIFSLEDVNRTQLSWFFPASSFKPNAVPSDVHTTWLAAKDMVTVPWSSGMTLQPGTVIYDATLPAPNVPTPDGNILIKKMADLQREQFVQVFFQPAFEPANPYMCDWMLVNGQYIPVVKFIVIRPLLGGELQNVAESPVGLVEPPVKEVWKQFNQSLDTGRSSLLVYNITTNEWMPGTQSFRTTTYPNDTLVFTFTDTVTSGNFLAIATGYDAATGGTQSKVYTWNFEVGGNPVVTTITLSPESTTLQLPDETEQTYTITVKDQYGNPMAGVGGTIATTFGTLSTTTFTTNASGQDTFSLSSSTAGVAVVTVSAGSLSANATCVWLPEVAEGTVNLYFEPAAQVGAAGQTYHLTIKAAAGTQEFDAAAIYVNFDPTKVKVTDASGNPVSSVNVNTTALPQVFVNTVNNSTGLIDVEAGTLGTPPTGDVVICDFYVTVQAGASGTINLVFSTTSPQNTDVLRSGSSVLGALLDGVIFVPGAPAS